MDARIISAIGSAGPRNIALISRMTGAPQETIRYKIKKRFSRLGFRFHAEVDHGKLGLSQHWSNLRFSRQYYNSASRLFETLNQVGYLTYYAKVLPQGHFVAIFSLPTERAEEFKGFLSFLEKRRILDGSSLEEAVVSRHPHMNPRFFNFGTGRWEVDWNKVRSDPGTPLVPDKERKSPVADSYDLLLIKELQKNALQHTVAIARSLKIDEKMLEYHNRVHVLGNRLVRSYIVRWTKDIEKRLIHSVLTTRFTFKNLDHKEFEKVQRVVSKIPYLWAEDLLRDGTYIATIHIPVTDQMSTFSYLSDEVSELDSKVEIGFLRPNESYLYTVPYEMFEDGEWKFDPGRMESAVMKTISSTIEK